MSGTLLDSARAAVKLATARGAGEAAATASRARQVALTYRDGKVEKVSEAVTRSLSLDLYVDGRYSQVSTSDLRDAALASFVEDAVAMARTIAPDAFRKLPDPTLYVGRAAADLKLVDDAGASALSADERTKLAKEMEEGARSAKGAAAILSVSAYVSTGDASSARVTSNGFEGERRATDFWTGANVTVKDADGRRPEQSFYAGARFLRELPSAGELGKKAAARAIARLGAKKVASVQTTMAVEARAAGRLLAALIAPLGARALQQRRSFLEGKRGERIFSDKLTLTDDPLLEKGFGSRFYDDEGIAAKPFAIVEAGVLKAYYVDDYYGRKLAMPATTARPSNLTFALGDKAESALLSDMGDGIIVTGFLGGNSNGTTGDYSFGIEGFRVTGGARAEPLTEMNISGNQLALWQALTAVGSDPYPYSSVRAPTLVFDGVQFAGT